MESNNNNENKLVEIPTLKNICAKLITQLLTQDIIKPEQVAYSLPIELVTLIKDQFPQKAFITKSSFSKYVEGCGVFKIIEGRYLWLKKFNPWRLNFFDTQTQESKDIYYDRCNACIDPVGLCTIGVKDNEMKWYDIKKDIEYTINNSYNFDLRYITFIKLRRKYVIIEDVNSKENFKKKIGIYSLQFNDNHIITLELVYTPILLFKGRITILDETKILIQEGQKLLEWPKYYILNFPNHIEKEWYGTLSPDYTLSKDKKLIAYTSSSDICISSLNDHLFYDSFHKEHLLPFKKEFETKWKSYYRLTKFLPNSSFVLTIGNPFATRDIYLWHWPTGQLIDHLILESQHGIANIFITPQYVEVSDFSGTLHRMNIDFIKAAEINTKLNKYLWYNRQRFSVNIKYAMPQYFLKSITQCASPHKTLLFKDNFDDTLEK